MYHKDTEFQNILGKVSTNSRIFKTETGRNESALQIRSLKMSAHPKDWQVIINPTAGQGRGGQRWARVSRKLGGSWQVKHTQYGGHLGQLAHEALDRGCRHLIGVGGDGTHHELINGILTHPSALDTTYALLPAGTGNDWARMWGISSRPDQWAAMFAQQQTAWQDVGLVTCDFQGKIVRRAFVNMAGLGYGANVVRHMKQAGKQGGGHLRYLVAGIQSLHTWKPQPVRMVIDGTPISMAVFLLQFGISAFAGGGMQFAPHAHPADGLLACTLIGEVSTGRIVRNLHRLYLGTIGAMKGVELNSVQEIRIAHLDEHEPLWLECDGELIGHTPVTLSVAPRALRVLCPEKSARKWNPDES